MLFDSLLPHIHTGNEGGRALSPAERPPEMFTLLHRGGADTHSQCSMTGRETLGGDVCGEESPQPGTSSVSSSSLCRLSSA